MECGSISNSSSSAAAAASLCKNVRDLDKLFSSILELGKALIGEGKDRFSVAIDLVSEMLRHTSMSSVAGLLSNLCSHDQVSCVFWLLHEDLHEIKVPAALEYMSSMLASIESTTQPTNIPKNNPENNSLIEQNFNSGKFHTRFKHRNGRVRVVCEEFCVEQSGIRFKSFSSKDGVTQSIVPKVQFNLQLSEKERSDILKERRNEPRKWEIHSNL